MERTVYYQKPNVYRQMLMIFDRNGHVQDICLQDNQILGRPTSEKMPDIPVFSRIISREHGQFGVIQDKCYYRDLGSSNGTWFNGKPCVEPVQVCHGDVFSFQSAKMPYACPEVKMLYLDAPMTDYVWKQIPLGQEEKEILIGRENSELHFKDDYVSRRHAVFFKAKDGWAVADLNSTNGVYLNSIRLQQSVYLQPMDIIRIGEIIFFYNGETLTVGCAVSAEEKVGKEPVDFHDIPLRQVVAGDEKLQIYIEKRDVWSRFRKKTLLKDIKLNISSGEMVLILGGSGAGKTTFMNAVMGYEKADGEIIFDDKDIYQEYEQMKYEIAYVPQQDLLRGADTVWGTLHNAAELRMPAQTVQAELWKKVEEVLGVFGLEREKETLVSKLSGGQRKRLSIACEYIGNPNLFFLDEPDSGLDGVMARSLMENLRDIGNMGKIVMVITHGPDRAVDLFDKVIVLAKSAEDDSGHLAFYGSVEEAKAFFQTDSLEGIIKRINRVDEGGDGLADEFIKKYREKCR